VRGDANYEELADIAAHQALRLERMLSELLQFGKPVTVQPADVPFLELLDEAMAGLRDIADAKGVRVRVEDELGRASLRVDREQMRRALANLLKNAIEASPDGGEVIVRAGLPADGGPQVDIQVHDAGPGIPAAMMPRLFQPFATTRDDGTGLGLAIVKKIVEMHGGIVRAENADDGGALFTLCVPRTPDPL